MAPAPIERHERRAILVNLLSESEVAGTLVDPMTVPDDTDHPPVRGYEVPGSFHLWHLGYGGHRGRRPRVDPAQRPLVGAPPAPLLDGIDRWSSAAGDPRAPDHT